MGTLTTNIPIKITISNDIIDSIELCDLSLSYLNVGDKDYSADVKSVLNTIFNKFNSKCDCKSDISNVIISSNDKIQEIEKQYKDQIEIMRNKFQDMLENIMKNGEKEYAVLLEKKESQIKLLEYKIEEQEKQYTHEKNINTEINDIKTNINKFFKGDNKTLGDVGEDYVYNYINKYFLMSDSAVEKVSNLSNACDIFLRYKSLKCGIEVKNHSTTIKTDIIKRFTEIDIMNKNYNCGIFISLKTTYANVANIKHFDIKFYHNKPVIFLSETANNLEHIIIAVKLLDFIVSNNSNKGNEIESTIQTVKGYIQSLEKLQRNNNQIMKIVKESNKDIVEVIKSIHTLLESNTLSNDSNKSGEIKE
jgi:TolA-binding protein